jgi:hypothetical protein
MEELTMISKRVLSRAWTVRCQSEVSRGRYASIRPSCLSGNRISVGVAARDIDKLTWRPSICRAPRDRFDGRQIEALSEVRESADMEDDGDQQEVER